MKRMLRLAALLFLSSCFHQFVIAQEDSPPDSVNTQPSDSLSDQPLVPFKKISAAHIDTLSSPYSPTKSPGLAMLFSAVLPGAGQFYNESYWKVPVALGFGTYFASEWLNNNRRAQDARDKYNAAIATDPVEASTQLRLREFYKKQRDTFAWYFLIFYLVNIADAYVDASLYDFDVGDDLSLRLIPDTHNRISLQLRF